MIGDLNLSSDKLKIKIIITRKMYFNVFYKAIKMIILNYLNFSVSAYTYKIVFIISCFFFCFVHGLKIVII